MFGQKNNIIGRIKDLQAKIYEGKEARPGLQTYTTTPKLRTSYPVTMRPSAPNFRHTVPYHSKGVPDPAPLVHPLLHQENILRTQVVPGTEPNSIHLFTVFWIRLRIPPMYPSCLRKADLDQSDSTGQKWFKVNLKN